MEPIFNMHKVKFSKLDELLEKNNPELFPKCKVNVFINLESVLKKLTTANVEQYLQIKTDDKSYELISNVINLIAHYRWFFSKNDMYSNIYVYMNYPFKTVYKNRVFNPDYRRFYEHRYTKDKRSKTLNYVMENTVPLIKIILDYVENVHFISADSVESSLVPKIITEHVNDKADFNFIVSNDRYDYQYVLNDFTIIRPKQDNSYVVTKNNLMKILKMEEKVVNTSDVTNNFYPFILSLLGDKYRNVDKIKGVGLSKLLTSISKAIDEGVITTDVSSINLLSNIIKEEFRPLLLKNFYCIDLKSQMSMLNSKDIQNIKSQCVNKFDNVSLKTLNDKYFKMYPLLLVELTSANALNRKPKQNIFK